MEIKKELLDVIRCDNCGGSILHDGDMTCNQCGFVVPMKDHIPIFTPVPEEIQPTPKEMRGPDIGTPWRQANWRFLEEQLSRLGPDDLIVDVGSGRGDFFDALAGRKYIALDVYPYPEVDIVCDLTKNNPFIPNSIDAVLVFNVVEHVYDTHALFDAISEMLKPGGVFLVTIPFMVKIHLLPIDFVRFTHYALDMLGQEHGFDVELIEGYYDPVFFLGEGIGNLKWRILRNIRGFRHYSARAILSVIRGMAELMKLVIGPGWVEPPDEAISLAPTGYHVIYRKK
jgi:SAM-dependent methyltransferase